MSRNQIFMSPHEKKMSTAIHFSVNRVNLEVQVVCVFSGTLFCFYFFFKYDKYGFNICRNTIKLQHLENSAVFFSHHVILLYRHNLAILKKYVVSTVVPYSCEVCGRIRICLSKIGLYFHRRTHLWRDPLWRWFIPLHQAYCICQT